MKNKKPEMGWYPGRSVNHWLNRKTGETLCGRSASSYVIGNTNQDLDNCTICKDIMTFVVDHTKFFHENVGEYTIKQRINRLKYEKENLKKKIQHIEKQIEQEQENLDEFRGDTLKKILKMAIDKKPEA